MEPTRSGSARGICPVCISVGARSGSALTSAACAFFAASVRITFIQYITKALVLAISDKKIYNILCMGLARCGFVCYNAGKGRGVPSRDKEE